MGHHLDIRPALLLEYRHVMTPSRAKLKLFLLENHRFLSRPTSVLKKVSQQYHHRYRYRIDVVGIGTITKKYILYTSTYEECIVRCCLTAVFVVSVSDISPSIEKRIEDHRAFFRRDPKNRIVSHDTACCMNIIP